MCPANSDQPVHPCSLISVFAGHAFRVAKDPKCHQADVQANFTQSLLDAHVVLQKILLCPQHILFKANGCICRKGNCQNCFTSLLKKKFHSHRKEFAPLESKFFPFRADPFSEGDWCAEEQTESHKSCLHCTKW